MLDFGIKYETRANGQAGSIVSYNLTYIFLYGWILPTRGSVFSGLELIVMLSVVLGVSTILAYCSCNYLGRESNCAQLPSSSVSFLTLMTLCSFVVAFFANTVITRWWSIRQFLQGVMGSSVEMMMLLVGRQDLRRSDEHGAQLDALIRKVNGLLLINLRLLFNGARDKLPVRDLIDREYFSEPEVEELCALSSTGNPSTALICAHILRHVQEAISDGVLGSTDVQNQAILAQISDSAKAIRANVGNILLFVNVQLPYPFIQIVTAVVYAFTVQLIVVCAAFISSGLTGNPGDMTTGYLTLTLYTFVLMGLLRLFGILENPLGEDPADFPGDTYCKEFKGSLDSLYAQVVKPSGPPKAGSASGGKPKGGAPRGDNSTAVMSSMHLESENASLVSTGSSRI